MPNPLLDLEKADRLLAQGAFVSALSRLARLRVPSRDPFLRGEILLKKAQALQGLSRFAPAHGAFEASGRAYAAARAASEETRARLGASACLRVLSRYPEARALWPKARLRSAESFLEAGLVERGLGNFSAARVLLNRAIAGARRTGDAGAERHAWWALGGTERFSGRFPQALKAFAQAEKKALGLQDFSALAYARCGQGGMLRVLGLGGQSEKKYRLAFAFFKKDRDLFGQAYGLCGIANTLRTFGDARKAIPLYRRSAALYRRLGDKSSEGFAHWGLAGCLRRLKRLGPSGAAYGRAHLLFEASGDARGEVMVRAGLARWAEGQSNAALARAQLRQGLFLSRRHSLPYETALLRAEQARLAGASYFPLASFGVPKPAYRRWRDIP